MKGIIQDECFMMNPHYATPSTPKNTILIPYLNKECISSMQEIGQGYFGKVYKGNRKFFLTFLIDKLTQV